MLRLTRNGVHMKTLGVHMKTLYVSELTSGIQICTLNDMGMHQPFKKRHVHYVVVVYYFVVCLLWQVVVIY